MAEISRLYLHGKRGEGQFAVIDSEMYPVLSMYKWYLSRNGYAVLSHKDASPYGETYLHRIITGAAANDIVDHINSIKLDCRVVNLRLTDRTGNNRNVGKRGHSKQPYKGVRLTATGRWAARIRCNSKEIYLGTFDAPEIAALAYNQAAESLFGSFARKAEV